MSSARARVIFSGQVQGVGFRYTSRSVARGFDVTGAVRNLGDGTVELEAQGQKSEVESFLSSLQSEMSHYIRDAALSWVESHAGESDFRIAF